MKRFRNWKVWVAPLLAAALFLLEGCAVVYYQKVQSGNRTITEAGLLGIPSTVSEGQPGGLLPLYRSSVPKSASSEEK